MKSKETDRLDEIIEALSLYLIYCPEEGSPETGYFKFATPRPGICAGAWAGSVSCYGYRLIPVNKKTWREHRLIYLIHHGYLPEQVDHINGNRLDNRIENLRAATAAQNNWNSPGKQLSNVGYRGVTLDKRDLRYQVRIKVQHKQISLGYYDCPIFAAIAYDVAAEQYHGEFATLNFPDWDRMVRT